MACDGSVKETLQSYVHRIDDISNLIGEKNRLHGKEKEQAQDLLRGLKDDLTIHLRDLHRNKEKLSHEERHYLEPALREANTRIHVRVNSVPSQKWTSELYSARIDLQHMLSQLKPS